MEYKSPEGLFQSKIYSQAVTVRGAGKTIYIGGQNAVNARGEIVGRGDLKAQTKQALENIRTILASEGATFENIVKLSIYMVQGCHPREGLAAFQETVGALKNKPLITVLFVPGLSNPAFLIEIDGIAVAEAD